MLCPPPSSIPKRKLSILEFRKNNEIRESVSDSVAALKTCFPGDQKGTGSSKPTQNCKNSATTNTFYFCRAGIDIKIGVICIAAHTVTNYLSPSLKRLHPHHFPSSLQAELISACPLSGLATDLPISANQNKSLL